MVVIFWVLTPLQSAIFATRLRTIDTHQNIRTISPLNQTNLLTSSFINTAYTVTWLNETIPGFVTQDHAYAVQPFALDDRYRSEFTHWTAPTTVYWAKFACTPASHSVSMGNDPEFYTFVDETGCIVQIGSLLIEHRQGSSYILPYYWFSGNTDSTTSPSFLNYPTKSKPTAIVVWGEIQNVISNNITFARVTASYCEASYFSQSANVTVASLNLSVSNVEITDQKQSIANTEFNFTDFEETINLGGPAVQESEGICHKFGLSQALPGGLWASEDPLPCLHTACS